MRECKKVNPVERQGTMPKEKITPQQNKKKQEQHAACFYGAQKSRNEIYFQIASVFREVSQDETWLAEAWMHRILMTRHPEHPDNTSRTSI